MRKNVIKSDAQYTKNYFYKDAGKVYNKAISDPYGRLESVTESILLKRIIKRAFNNKIPGYLDFACGTGRITQLFEGYAKKSFGIDTADQMLKEAKKRAKNTTFICGDILDKKLTKQKFDCITSFRLFLNLDRHYRLPLLKKLHTDYLKDDGYFIVNLQMNRYSIIGLNFWLRKLLFNSTSVMETATEAEFTRMLKKAGYRVVDVKRFALIPGRKSLLLYPFRLGIRIELFLSKVPLLNLFSKNILFICQKR